MDMNLPRVTARAIVVAAVALAGALALAAALALATAGGHGFAAKQRVLAVRCAGGRVLDAGGDCAPLGAPEGPIESFTAAAQRAAKTTSPFATVAPGAYANALAQRAKKSKTGGSWAPVGSGPLHADSP